MNKLRKSLLNKAICYLIILGMILFLHFNKYIDLEFIRQNHFNFITVNSIFSGFLFTSLGILVGFNSNSAIKKFERISTMDKIYTNIIIGIIFSIMSMAISIGLLILNIKLPISIVDIILCFEIYFLILTVIQFVISVKYTYFAIKVVRTDIKKNLPSKESIDETLKKIK